MESDVSPTHFRGVRGPCIDSIALVPHRVEFDRTVDVNVHESVLSSFRLSAMKGMVKGLSGMIFPAAYLSSHYLEVTDRIEN